MYLCYDEKKITEFHVNSPPTTRFRAEKEGRRKMIHLSEVISTSASTWRPILESMRDAVPALSSHLSWSLSTKVTHSAPCVQMVSDPGGL